MPRYDDWTAYAVLCESSARMCANEICIKVRMKTAVYVHLDLSGKHKALCLSSILWIFSKAVTFDNFEDSKL